MVLVEVVEPQVLTPERFLELGQALDSAGFHGDFKVPLTPGSARFQYNNVIVHAPSAAQAACAEAVVLEVLGRDVERVGRGADAVVGRLGPLSWHEWLLATGDEALPAAVQRFVEESGWPTVDACPGR